MCNDLIDILEWDLLDVHELCADLVDGIILVNKKRIWGPVQVWEGQDGVVVLNNNLEKYKKKTYSRASFVYYSLFTRR